MHGNLQAPISAATNAASASDSDSEITSGLDSDDWFGPLVRPMLGKEPGVALHHMVGPEFPISTCAKYVSKTETSRRQPPGYLIRALLRSEQGGAFLNAVMHGSEAQWWLDMERERKLAAVAQRFKAELEQIDFKFE